MDSNKRPDTMERITTFELAEKFIEEQVAEIKAQVGDKKVLLALSGGVDSSVVAALLIKAIGKQLVCVHVNHGLMRKGESEQVIEVFGKALDANLVFIELVRFKIILIECTISKRHSAEARKITNAFVYQFFCIFHCIFSGICKTRCNEINILEFFVFVYSHFTTKGHFTCFCVNYVSFNMVMNTELSSDP